MTAASRFAGCVATNCKDETPPGVEPRGCPYVNAYAEESSLGRNAMATQDVVTLNIPMDVDPKIPLIHFDVLECFTCGDQSDYLVGVDCPNTQANWLDAWTLKHMEENPGHNRFNVWRATRNSTLIYR